METFFLVFEVVVVVQQRTQHMGGIASRVTEVLWLVGSVGGYYLQYKMIQKKRNAEGFSVFVCLLLLLSNVLQCFLLFGNVLSYAEMSHEASSMKASVVGGDNNVDDPYSANVVDEEHPQGKMSSLEIVDRKCSRSLISLHISDWIVFLEKKVLIFIRRDATWLMIWMMGSFAEFET